MKYQAGNNVFSSVKEDIHFCVLFADGSIAAKCSSLDLAQKAKEKDERLYKLKDMSIVEAVKL